MRTSLSRLSTTKTDTPEPSYQVFLMFKGVSRPRKKLSTDDFIGVYVKLESCEETIVVLFGMQKPWNYPNAVRGEDNSVVLVRMPDC